MIQNSSLPAFMFYTICGQFLSDTNDKIKSKRDIANVCYLHLHVPFLCLTAVSALLCHLPHEMPSVSYDTFP